ncbi:MAG: 4Fe-4S binding protein [Armatimonadetes bacterium]|nr:4Fe-4S binding protein [Armatimonadota bacterium]
MGLPDDWPVQIEESASHEDGGRFTIRLHVSTGVLSAEQLGVLRDVARQYGQGYVHLTARQGIELPGVSLRDLSAVQASLAHAGLSTGSAGSRVRNVVACTGGDKCQHAFLDGPALGHSLDMLLGGEDLPTQVKVAVASCPNSCTAPQMADIGFVGTVEPVLDRALCNGCGACTAACDERALTMRRGLPRRDPQRCHYCGACVVSCPTRALRAGRVGYMVYVGGRVGRRPQMGHVLARFVPEDEAPDLAGRILGFLRDYGEPRERLYPLIRRVGLDLLRARVHSRPLHRTPIREA